MKFTLNRKSWFSFNIKYIILDILIWYLTVSVPCYWINNFLKKIWNLMFSYKDLKKKRINIIRRMNEAKSKNFLIIRNEIFFFWFVIRIYQTISILIIPTYSFIRSFYQLTIETPQHQVMRAIRNILNSTHHFFLGKFPCKRAIFLSLWKSSFADNC